jgi:hypothetical protein
LLKQEGDGGKVDDVCFEMMRVYTLQTESVEWKERITHGGKGNPRHKANRVSAMQDENAQEERSKQHVQKRKSQRQKGLIT